VDADDYEHMTPEQREARLDELIDAAKAETDEARLPGLIGKIHGLWKMVQNDRQRAARASQ
jgi:hypothetical protein